jgi:hypothetical protein
MQQMDVSQVFPNVFVGSYPPSPEDIDRLRRGFGITAVLNAQTAEEMACLGGQRVKSRTGAVG